MPGKTTPSRVFVSVALAAVLASSPVLGQTSEQEWGPILRDQMLVSYDCEVAFFSQVAERSVNGEVIVIAKVHCIDKRTFDAYRPGSFEAFEVHPCENPENRIC